MKFRECFFTKPNLDHHTPTEFNGEKYIGCLAVYCPTDMDRGGLRVGGNYAQPGDLMLIRAWTQAYQKENLGSFKVGPLGSINPQDFRNDARVSDVFVIPKDKEGLVAEYNKLVEAAEELDDRLAWMETKDKKDFSESEYRTDKIILELDVDISGEKEENVKKLLKDSIKI